ncbi:hypothetical protein MMC31_003128 [Peltigera leucophlebia]|nr:hypothetical protein [Peltigera leucophlebia]
MYQIQQKIDALPKSSQPLPPAMQPSAFLKALADLNTANPDILQDFLDATQAQSSANLPKPIPIGTHDGIQYFIKSSDKAVHEDSSSAAIPPAKTGEVFYGISTYEAKSVLGGQSTTTDLDYGLPANSGDDFYGISAAKAKSSPVGQTITTDLNYGFGLGRLYHKIPNAADMEDTGFYIICNAVDKSIWVAFDFEPYGETGDINPVKPEYGHPYGELPVDTQKMVIGIMRLFRKGWTAKKPLSLDGGDPFRNGAGTPLACKLVAKPAFVADVLNAIKAGSAKPALSRSS